MKTILLAGAVMLGLLHSAGAYSLGGPIGNGGDAWQAPVIGYGLGGDLYAPKNIGEEFRRNTKVMYYAFDPNFLGFFGSNGVVAVDGAFAIMNNLTNVSKYSPSLSEFPLESRHVNYQAQALGLYDLKSWTLGALMEQVGLADPIRYTWTLHDRFKAPGPACPASMEYLVVQRNFDFVSSPLNQLQYSPYVNDVLYSYQIEEFCTAAASAFPPALAIATPFSVDPLADVYSPVASAYGGLLVVNTSFGVLLTVAPGIASYGSFYTGLTRDDVAGLRYLLQTNNINWETPAPGSLLLTTNIGSTVVIANLDLGLLSASALTNDPVTLAGLFPNLIITSVTTNFTVVCTPNIISYLTNLIGAPAGSPPLFVVLTNGFNCAYQPVYAYSFGNVITNTFSKNSTVQVVTIALGTQIGAPAGSPLVTNITTTTTILTNVPSGDYFIIPPADCGLNIVPNSGITSGVTMTTNVIATTTNASGFTYSQSIVTTFTNRQYLANPVICGTAATATGLYQGIENMKFVRSSFDSLLGQFFQPITNTYTMVMVTNSQAKQVTLQRVVIAPDFLFSAADLATGPSALPVVFSFSRNLNFDTANVLPGLAGPGTITPATTITFDKVGPVYFNSFGDVLDGSPYFNETPGGDLSDFFYLTYFVWASYDGTTNAPVVYPDGTSIDNLENQILIQITPTSVPSGTNGTNYVSTTFTAAGGAFTPPYTWSATGLPDGMIVSSGGTLSGTPSASGTFVFTLTLTDYIGRSVQWNYSLTIYAASP